MQFFLVFQIKLYKTLPFTLVIVHSLAAKLQLKPYFPYGNLFCIDWIKADLAFPKQTVQLVADLHNKNFKRIHNTVPLLSNFTPLTFQKYHNRPALLLQP